MNNYTTIKRNFKYLTAEKRAQIEILTETGMSKADVARTIGIARSTLYEELKRGTAEQIDSNLKTYKRYFHELGQKVYSAHRKNRRIYGESIEHRPISAENRSEFGHLEIDTVIGSNESSQCLLTLDGRLSRYRIIEKIDSRSAEAVSAGIKRILDRYVKYADEMFKTVTADNGGEFSALQKDFLFAKIYYAHPYSSFERGTNERQNGIIRRFFPKGKSFNNISDETILFVQNWINSLPRKIFNYRCSNDFFSLFVNFL